MGAKVADFGLTSFMDVPHCILNIEKCQLCWKIQNIKMSSVQLDFYGKLRNAGTITFYGSILALCDNSQLYVLPEPHVRAKTCLPSRRDNLHIDPEIMKKKYFFKNLDLNFTAHFLNYAS